MLYVAYIVYALYVRGFNAKGTTPSDSTDISGYIDDLWFPVTCG